MSTVKKTIESQKQSKATLKKEKIAFFYSIYLPSSKYNHSLNEENPWEIVSEQIEILARSDTARETGITLFYGILGVAVEDDFTVSNITALCRAHHPRLDCVHMQHYMNKPGGGDEGDTLQELYEYCQQQRHNDSKTITRVGYIHSKGSLRQTAWRNGAPQGPWRRHGLLAAASQRCTRPRNASCNVCSLLTTVWPFVHPT